MQVSDPSLFSLGAVLAGKYRVERVIGQGGMGVVVEARHVALDERVALKFLLPEFASHPDAAARFLREARAAVKIRGEHVARVSDVGTLENGSPYMVMEFLEGQDLSQLLEQQRVLGVEDAIDFVVQACDALAEAHAHGIVHRDIKPANLFLARRMDGSPLVKVLDFGISKVMNAGGVENLTRTTATMGSALYMSPEQIQAARSVDHRTDIYALGITLYELLTGQQPFLADTFPQLCVMIATADPTPLRSVRPDLPEDFAAVVQRAFARSRDERYQTVGEMVVALAPWAPARSQPIIERVARTTGAVAPTAAVPAMNAAGTYAGADTRAPQPGGTTDLSSAAPPRSSSRAGLWVGLAAALVVVVGGAVALVVRSHAAAGGAAAGSSADVTSAAPVSLAPPAPASAGPAATPEPSASAAPEPVASAAAPASAEAPAAPAPKRPTAVRPTRPATQVSAPAKPTPQPAPSPTRKADEYR